MLRISLVTLLLIGFVAALGCESCRISGGSWCTRDGYASICRVGGCPEGFCEVNDCPHPTCCPVCDSNYDFINSTSISSVITTPVCYQPSTTAECGTGEKTGWVVFNDRLNTTCNPLSPVNVAFPEDECYNAAGPNFANVPNTLSSCPTNAISGNSVVMLSGNQTVAWRRLGDNNVTFDINAPGNVPMCDTLCPDTTDNAACNVDQDVYPFLSCEACPFGSDTVCGAILPTRGCSPTGVIAPREVCSTINECDACTHYVTPNTLDYPCVWSFATESCETRPADFVSNTNWFEIDRYGSCDVNTLSCRYTCPAVPNLLQYFKTLLSTSSNPVFRAQVQAATALCEEATNGIPGIGCTTGVFNMSTRGLEFDLPYDFFCAISQIPVASGITWKTLDLSDNLIGGIIPPTIGVLSNLQFVHLENNVLTGGVSEGICCLTHVQYLYLNNNCLTGNGLPDCLCNLDAIQEVHFNSNRQLVGFLPACWVGVPSLFEMHAECTGLREPYPGYLEFMRRTRVQPNEGDLTFPALGYYDCGFSRCSTQCAV